MPRLLADLSFAMRLWRKHRLHTILILLTTAMCVGANIAVFSAVYGVLLKPLNLPEPDRLCVVYNTQPGIGLPISSVAYPDYLDRREADAFAESAVYHWESVSLTGDGPAVSVVGVRTTHTFFDTVGVAPELGRGWDEAQHTPGETFVAVISHRLWQNQFGGRADILGAKVQLDREAHEIIGVMPAGFDFPARRIDLWRPKPIEPAMLTDDERGHEYWTGVARLRPGVTIEAARTQLDEIQRANEARLPDQAEGWQRNGFGPYLRGIVEHRTKDEAPLLWMVQTVGLFVLALGLLNVLGLFVTQTIGRAHELSVRASVGANWRQLWAQLTTEALGLMGLAGGLGLALAWGLLRFFNVLGFGDLPRSENIDLDLPVVVAGGLIVLLLGLTLGTAQTLYVWRAGLAQQLRENSTRAAGNRLRSRLRSVLVITEISLALVLITGAGLLTRSFFHLLEIDPGYDPNGVAYGRFSVPEAAYPENNDKRLLFQRLQAAAAAIPGVAEAGLCQVLPFSGSNWGTSYFIEGREVRDGESRWNHCDYRVASPGYFEAIGTTVLEGRSFNAGDGAPNGEPAAIVSRYWRDAYSPDASPLGRRVSFDGGPDDEDAEWATIVGVVEDVRFGNLDQTPSKEMVYQVLNDNPVPFMNLVVRAEPGLDPTSLLAPMREALAEVDPLLPFSRQGTLQSYLDEHLAGRQAAMSLIVLSGLLAFFLALTGLYGMLSFSVRQRQSEIGVRMALGASPQQIFRQFGSEGGRLVIVGLGCGTLAAILLGRFLQAMLFGLSATDPTVLASAALALAMAAFAALYLPTRRAMRTDPARALRED